MEPVVQGAKARIGGEGRKERMMMAVLMCGLAYQFGITRVATTSFDLYLYLCWSCCKDPE
jgi:hypothetical protein